MERCECLPLHSKFARKRVLVKTKRSTDKVISINQSLKLLSTGTNTCPQPSLPLINGLVDDALLELSPERNWSLLFLQGSVATLFTWSWKILSYCVANLSKTLHIQDTAYQYLSKLVKYCRSYDKKNLVSFFMPHSVHIQIYMYKPRKQCTWPQYDGGRLTSK